MVVLQSRAKTHFKEGANMKFTSAIYK